MNETETTYQDKVVEYAAADDLTKQIIASKAFQTIDSLRMKLAEVEKERDAYKKQIK